MTIQNTDIELIERLIDIKNKGLYANGMEVTQVYNRVFNKNLSATSCGSCIRQRINELEGALTRFREEMAKLEEEKRQLQEVKVEENEPTTKKRGRKK